MILFESFSMDAYNSANSLLADEKWIGHKATSAGYSFSESPFTVTVRSYSLNLMALYPKKKPQKSQTQ